MGYLQNRVVAVIGGSSGMGRVTALALAREGAAVVVGARRQQLCEQVASEIRAAGGQSEAIALDATDADSVAEFFRVLHERHGRLDGAFNNVGRTLGSSSITETTLERFEQTLAFNLQEVRLMRDQGHGAIVNNSSIGGSRGFAGLQDYCAAKWGVVGLTKAVALENAAHNLRINVIAPGLVATERFELIRSQQPTIIGDRLKEIPLARPGSMAEIAETVLWLLGPASGFLTGAVIPLDGGECAK